TPDLGDSCPSKGGQQPRRRFPKMNHRRRGAGNASRPDQLLAIDDALAKLADLDATAAQLVQLRYFAGLSVEQAGKALGISTATAYRHWKYARAWLYSELCDVAP